MCGLGSLAGLIVFGGGAALVYFVAVVFLDELTTYKNPEIPEYKHRKEKKS